MLIDLHNHTAPQSWDSMLSPDELAVKAKEAGLDGICLTEHDQFWTLEEARELSRRHGFLVLPGVEITTEDGHLLVYGLHEYVYGMHRAPFLKEQVDMAGGVMVVAHPYRRNFREDEGPWVPSYDDQVAKASNNQTFGFAVAVETINGRGSGPQNGFSASVRGRLGMPATAGSDSHDVADIGACATDFSRRITDLESLIVELRAGRFRAVDLRHEAEHDELSMRTRAQSTR